METDTFVPLLTREIPLPIVEAGLADALEGPLPRSLAQAAGLFRARVRVSWTLGIFILLIGVETALLVRTWKVEALVVYQTGSKTTLVGR